MANTSKAERPGGWVDIDVFDVVSAVEEEDFKVVVSDEEVADVEFAGGELAVAAKEAEGDLAMMVDYGFLSYPVWGGHRTSSPKCGITYL